VAELQPRTDQSLPGHAKRLPPPTGADHHVERFPALVLHPHQAAIRTRRARHALTGCFASHAANRFPIKLNFMERISMPRSVPSTQSSSVVSSSCAIASRLHEFQHRF
jgi:hypothetical protein